MKNLATSQLSVTKDDAIRNAAFVLLDISERVRVLEKQIIRSLTRHDALSENGKFYQDIDYICQATEELRRFLVGLSKQTVSNDLSATLGLIDEVKLGELREILGAGFPRHARTNSDKEDIQLF